MSKLNKITPAVEELEIPETAETPETTETPIEENGGSIQETEASEPDRLTNDEGQYEQSLQEVGGVENHLTPQDGQSIGIPPQEVKPRSPEMDKELHERAEKAYKPPFVNTTQSTLQMNQRPNFTPAERDILIRNTLRTSDLQNYTGNDPEVIALRSKYFYIPPQA